MAVDVEFLNGNNVNNINNNFQRVKNALQEVVGRNGNLPNHMNADLDMNSNDILNVDSIDLQRIVVDGEEFDPRQMRGWSPVFAAIEYNGTVVMKLVDYVGGQGIKPTQYINWYVGSTGYVQNIDQAIGFGSSGVTDGDKGDITVSGNGTAWEINPAARVPPNHSVTEEKLSAPLLALAQTKRTPKMFGAAGDDTGDDTAAILAALSDGPVIGDPGAVYRMNSQLLLPTDVDSFFDLNGATIHSVWNGNYPFRGVAPTFVSSVVTSGINPGTLTVVVTDGSLFAVGDEVFVDFNGPVQIRKIVGKSSNTLTVDRPWDHDTAGGVITLYKCAFRPKFALMNGTIDFDGVPVGRSGFSYIDHWESQLYQELDFINFNLDTNGNINVPWRSREVMLDHCKFLDTKSGQFMTAFKNETVTMRDNYGRGDAFGLAVSYSSAAHFIDNHIEGRFYADNDPPSTRGIKTTWCQGGTVAGNTIRGYDSGVKVEDCGGFAITGNVVEWCGTGVNTSNQNPSSRTVGHLIEGNNLRFIQGVCAIQVSDSSVTAHKVADNLIYRPKGDGIRGDATYIGITDNHIIEYGYDPAAPGTPDVTKYPVVLTGASQLGVLDGNYAFAPSPSTARGYYVANTASNFRIGLNHGNLPAERLYNTLPAPAKNTDVFLPGGRIKKTFEAALTTSYANYSFPTAFPHGFLTFEGAFPIDGPGSNTAGSVVCNESSGTNASQVRLAAAVAGTYRITVIGY